MNKGSRHLRFNFKETTMFCIAPATGLALATCGMLLRFVGHWNGQGVDRAGVIKGARLELIPRV